MAHKIQTVTRILIGSWLVVGLLLVPTPATAQMGGGGFGGGGFGGGGGGFGGGQGQGQGGFNFAGGIVIDGSGVLSAPKSKTVSVEVAKRRMQELAKEHLPADILKSSSLRKVSLVRLERAMGELIERRDPIPTEMQYLAGLQRIDFVFVFPETRDVVIAGPAEPFAPDATGRAIGLSNGRPVLRLDDLMVAMRTQETTSELGCSIDPVEERMAELQRFVQANSQAGSANSAQRRFQQMQRILGNQEVRVFGVPNDTHFAQTLVEADYHMKLIAIGLEDPKVPGLKSHLAMVTAGTNSLKRWWFMPLYDSFKTSGDGLAFEFAGQRCQLLAQEEQVDATGKRSDAAFTRVSTQLFAQQFTEKFPELAKRMPVFGELQNLFDLAILAALLKSERLPQKAEWAPALLLDDAKAPVLRGPVPKQTKTVLNMKMTSGGIAIGLLSGGVLMNSQQVVPRRREDFQVSADVSRRREQEVPQKIVPQRWWWD